MAGIRDVSDDPHGRPSEADWVEHVEDRLWTRGQWLSWWGTRFPARMSLVRIDGGLLLHSPLELSTKDLEKIQHWGEVRWIVSPNHWHHLFLEEAVETFPSAEVYLPPWLAERYPGVPLAGTLDDARPEAWNRQIRVVRMEGSPLIEEYVFVVPELKTVIVGDLIEHIGPENPWMTRLLARPHGVYNRYATPRLWRWTTLNTGAMKEAVERILELEPTRLVPAHGPIASSDAEQVLRRALAWIL